MHLLVANRRGLGRIKLMCLSPRRSQLDQISPDKMIADSIEPADLSWPLLLAALRYWANAYFALIDDPRRHTQASIRGQLCVLRVPPVFGCFHRGDWVLTSRYSKLFEDSETQWLWAVHPELVPLLRPNLPARILLPGDPIPSLPKAEFPIAGLLWGCTPSPNRRYLRSPKPSPFASQTRPRVGVCWTAQHPNRVVPLTVLLPWLQELSQFFELANLTRERSPIPMRETAIADCADLAAAIAACDFVISSDTLQSNLCGSLGKPGVVLLPSRDWDARWGRGDRPHWRSNWYPSLVFCKGRNWADTVAIASQAIGQLNPFSLE